MKPLVIHHDNCADGFGAAFVAWLTLGEEAEYLPMQYGAIPTTLAVDNREVYVLDFSFPRAVMDGLFAAAKRVVWLDHHKTAFEMWLPQGERNLFVCSSLSAEDPWRHHIVLDNNKSGALLAWEYFHPGKEVPMLFRHIDDYDRWQFKLDGTKAFNKALWSYAPWSFEAWRHTFFFPDHVPRPQSVDIFVDDGEAILRAHNQNVQSAVKGTARACWIQQVDNRGAVTSHGHGLSANCPPHLTSDVGHELATRSDTFGLCWCIDKDGRCKCSLRSNGDYDVSAIAKAFGGGGHKNAAGFTVPVEQLLGWFK
jgi:hypothetical protein